MSEDQDPGQAIDYCYQQGWAADGLPVMPPTRERVSRFIAETGRDPDEVVATMEPIHRRCTLEKAAINAVMAGCLPEYFPVVVAALEALEDERYCFHGSTVSTGGCAPLLIINGPARRRLEVNAGVNVFGPGYRANATIGRAIRLIQLNVFGMHPGSLDQSTHGFPGKYSLCIAENEEESPWAPLHVELGFDAGESTVTVWGARSVVQVQARRARTPEGILLTILDTMCQVGSIQSERQTALVMGPEHAQLIARHGWSKPDVRRFLYENARRPVLDPDQASPAGQPGREAAAEAGEVRLSQVPEDFLLVVAGGRNAGVSSVLHPWGKRLSPDVGAMPPPGVPSMDYVTRPIRGRQERG